MQLATTVFSPARRIMDRLSYAWKFILIAVVLLAPLGWVGWNYLGVQKAQTEFSAKERVGIRYIVPATGVLDAMVQARHDAVLAAAEGAGPDAVSRRDASAAKLVASFDMLAAEDARDGAELKTTKMLTELRSASTKLGKQQFTSPSAALEAWNVQTTAALALILQAGNESNLILDPDLDSYYFMDSHVIRIVTLIDLIGQAQDVQQVIELEGLTGDALVDKRLQLSNLLGQIDFNHGTLDGNYNVYSFPNTDTPTTKASVINELTLYLASQKQLRANIEGAVQGRINPIAGQQLERTSRADLVALQEKTSPQLDFLIVDRISVFTAAKKTTLMVSGAALLVALFLFGGFYQSVRHALRQLLGASEAIGRGELDGNLDVSSRDEIGVMANSFRLMASNLRETAGAAKRIAVGDVQVDVALRSDHDELGTAFRDMVVYLQETAVVAEALSRGDLSITHAPKGEQDALGLALQDVVGYLRDMSDTAGVAFADLGTHISEQAQIAERIADGDLSVEVVPRTEADVLGHAFRRMSRNLREVIVDMSESAASVSASSQQLSATSREVTSEMEDVSTNVDELARGAAEQIGILSSASTQAQEAAAATSLVVETASQGTTTMRTASDAMRELEASSREVTGTMHELEAHGQRIGAIIDTITAIADQTNLLALNAAIEAARAGDAGRGFAVVADEVRKLAEESQGAAQSVAEIVASMQGETHRAVEVIDVTTRRATTGAELVEEARAAFASIDQAVVDADVRVDAIARASADAASLADQSNDATARVGQATSQTTASMQEVAAASSELARLAEELSRTTGRFQLGSESGIRRAHDDATAPEVLAA